VNNDGPRKAFRAMLPKVPGAGRINRSHIEKPGSSIVDRPVDSAKCRLSSNEFRRSLRCPACPTLACVFDGKSGLPSDDRASCPSTDNLVQKTATARENVFLAEGQFVKRGGDKSVWYVKRGITVVALEATAVLKEGYRPSAANRAAVIERFRPGVTGKIRQTGRQPPSYFHTQKNCNCRYSLLALLG